MTSSWDSEDVPTGTLTDEDAHPAKTTNIIRKLPLAASEETFVMDSSLQKKIWLLHSTISPAGARFAAAHSTTVLNDRRATPD